MDQAAKSELEYKNELMKQLVATKDTLEKLRILCLMRGASGIKGLGRSFLIIDDDQSKKIEYSEFVKGVRDYGLKLSDAETKSLFQRLDKDNSGFIDYDEFIIALRPPMSQSRLRIIDLAFKKLDKSGDGVVTVDDLKGVYNVTRHPKFITGEMSEKQIFESFLASFEAADHKDGKVTKDEFVNYYAAISASIDSDAYFDLMMRNSWKL
uniref:EF-hand domain-containing protein n=1 Tax=Romanomermis culicivorax TaxID=13658 RepID=A0A915IU36_ROMCU